MKDAYTIAGPLDQAIRKAYDEVVSDTSIKAVFYLPNSVREPRIILVNYPIDNRSEFEGFVSNLHSENHQINGIRDVDSLIDLFSQHDFLLSDGVSKYSSIQLVFFTCASFDIESSFIPRLFFSLDLDRLPEGQVHLTIMHSGDDDTEQAWKTHFDHWNICKSYQIATY